MVTSKAEFFQDLANLMEKHGVAIGAKTFAIDEKSYSEVIFQAKGISLIPKVKRCHVTAYDIRTECLGLSSCQANELYHLNKVIHEKAQELGNE